MRTTFGVAIATYNGRQYIESQLESICRQTAPPQLISISDDCSTDGTFEYLVEFRRRSRIPVVLSANAKRLGVIDNFLVAFRQCQTDYIAYCDQDDVWHEDKLATCRDILDRRRFALLLHKSETVDEHLRPLGSSSPFNVPSGTYTFPHFPDRLWGFGHQMIFSKVVFEALTRIMKSVTPQMSAVGLSFDRALLVAAGSVGDIYFLNKALMQFRRHAGSVSPAGKPVKDKDADRCRDDRKLQVKRTLQTVNGLLAEIETDDFARRLSSLSGSRYIEHLLILRQRYEQRSVLYDSSSFGARIRAYGTLLSTRSYGSARRNQLSARQLVLDSWRAIRGDPGRSPSVPGRLELWLERYARLRVPSRSARFNIRLAASRIPGRRSTGTAK